MRRFMLVLIGLLLICSFCLAEEDAVTSATLKIDRLPKIESQDSRILVVYFSATGTTRSVAEKLAEGANILASGTSSAKEGISIQSFFCAH